MDKAKKSADLTKGSSTKNSPELKESELAKVSGGLKFDGVDGESTHKDHKGEIG